MSNALARRSAVCRPHAARHQFVGNGPATAQETPPKLIRIGAPGSAEAKPFGTGTIGALRVKGYLEEKFKKDGVAIQWQFPRGTGPAIKEAFGFGARPGAEILEMLMAGKLTLNTPEQHRDLGIVPFAEILAASSILDFGGVRATH